MTEVIRGQVDVGTIGSIPALTIGSFPQQFDPFFLISRGQLPGYSAAGLAGVLRDVDTATTPEDIWGGGGLFPYQATAQTLEVVSDSANDTAAGTGARSVVVIGLDSNWAQITEVVTTSGTTPASTTHAFLRVNAFRIVTCGSAGSNAGTVTLRVAGAGATQGLMNPLEGQCMRAVYTVPAGFTGFLLDCFVAIVRAGTNESVEFAFQARTNMGPWITRNIFSVSANGLSTLNLQPRIFGALAEKTDVRFTAVNVSANNTTCQATFIVVLKAN